MPDCSYQTLVQLHHLDNCKACLTRLTLDFAVYARKSHLRQALLNDLTVTRQTHLHVSSSLTAVDGVVSVIC